MRAKQFIIEYSRDVTKQRLGQAVLARFQQEPVQWQSRALDIPMLPLQRLMPGEIGGDESMLSREELVNKIIEKLEAADPTKNKQYVPWLARTYTRSQAHLEDVLSTISGYLVKFHQLSQRKKLPPEHRDILTYPTFGEFVQTMNNYPDVEDKLVDRGQAEQVFENSDVRIIVPKDEKAACYYGQGTRWCTAATQSTNYFERYNRSGKLYILLPKKPIHPGEKYQLHFGTNQFMDENDDPVDVLTILSSRFGDLEPFFYEHEPEIKSWLMFAPNEVLEPLLKKFRVAVEQHLWEMVGDWEVHDDYYYEWLREHGYGYPEGHEEEGQIDWDRVAEDGVSYVDWNDELRYFMSDVMDAVKVSPGYIRDEAGIATRESSDDVYTLTNLDHVIAENIRKEVRNHQYEGAAEGIADWVEKFVYVRRGNDHYGAWDVVLLGAYDSKDGGRRKEYEIHV